MEFQFNSNTFKPEDTLDNEYRPVMTGNSPILARKLTNVPFSDETWKRVKVIPFESKYSSLPSNPISNSNPGVQTSSKDRYKKKLYKLKIQRGNKNKKH